jgi:hypothetical protein
MFQIQSAKACVGHLFASRSEVVRVICEQSDLDVHPTEVTILVPEAAVSRPGRYPRTVMSGGVVLGSYVEVQS